MNISVALGKNALEREANEVRENGELLTSHDGEELEELLRYGKERGALSC